MAKYELKTRKNEGDVYDFIQSVDDPQRRQDSLELIKIMADITGQAPKMWGKSIIGFGSYHYKYDSGQEGDWMATGFSPRKQSLTIYLMSGFDRFEDLLKKLGKHSTSVGCLYIKKLEDVDKSVLKKLIKQSYKYVKSDMDQAEK